MTRIRASLSKTYRAPSTPTQNLSKRHYELITSIMTHKKQYRAAHTLNTSTSSISKYLKHRGTNYKAMRDMLCNLRQPQNYTPEHKHIFQHTIRQQSLTAIFFSHTYIMAAMFLTPTPEEAANLLDIPFLDLLNYLHKQKQKLCPVELLAPPTASPTSITSTPPDLYDNADIQADADTNWHTLPGSSLDLASLSTTGFFASPFEDALPTLPEEVLEDTGIQKTV